MLQPPQLLQRADAAGGGDVQALDLDQLLVELQVGPPARAVPADVGVDDRPHPRVPEAAAEVHPPLLGQLLPAVDGHVPVPGVHAHGDLVPVGLDHAGGKAKVLYGNRAQDAAAHPQVQVLADALLGADAAAHLYIEAALFRDGGDAVKVGHGAVPGPVQVHHVEIPGPGLQEGPGLGGGVRAVDGLLVIVPLVETDHLAAPQVDGGKNLHAVAPFTIPRRPAEAAGPRPRTSPGGTGPPRRSPGGPRR